MQIEQLIDQGVALGKQNRLDDAISVFHQAIEANPNHPRAHANLAVALQKLGRLDESLAASARTIELAPGEVNSLHTHGRTLMLLNRLPEAIEFLRRAVQISPQDGEIHSTLAKALLLTGDFKRGWAEYEWRWKAVSFNEPKRTFAQPQWTGVAKLVGKTILLHHEQGFGDTIQFVRYAPLLSARGADVIVQAPRELMDLIRRMPGAPEVIPLGAPIPAIDFHIPLMSLPLAFNTTPKTIPANVPYMSASVKVAQVWAERMKEDGGGFRVGLAWAGRSTHLDDEARSMPLQTLAPLAAVENVTFYSLQKWDPNNEARNPPPGMRLMDAAAKLFDFSDSAALIANLDLVICVDTAVAHLAGAMGKEVWVLLPFSPDFRWLLDRGDSPWYPTMRLFRQRRPRQWSDVIAEVIEQLRQRLSASGK